MSEAEVLREAEAQRGRQNKKVQHTGYNRDMPDGKFFGIGSETDSVPVGTQVFSDIGTIVPGLESLHLRPSRSTQSLANDAAEAWLAGASSSATHSASPKASSAESTVSHSADRAAFLWQLDHSSSGGSPVLESAAPAHDQSTDGPYTADDTASAAADLWLVDEGSDNQSSDDADDSGAMAAAEAWLFPDTILMSSPVAPADSSLPVPVYGPDDFAFVTDSWMPEDIDMDISN